ncbi:50S ribosomal protein L5 [Spiroplasma chinense]|uniref:Large ribosomal subunit protein uL5 n=1 Tax=Spiroplasma chinense TaxID=216932 RepID=A0A5B9Y6G3_9MOLU|nr:50S ribosomal protein L5 [Spiroplasma chinense]QEH62316.1 50S ribosomal protein L5 [Spiroplasma chinense]
MAKANVNRLEKLYKDKIVPELFKEKQFKSVMEVPKITKIVVNQGIGDAVQDSKRLDDAVAELALITGQKPLVTKAKKSLAAFKLREGMPIGAKVTLRGKKMYEFLDKLISVALPRVRDFRGVSKTSFDKQGNYTMGVKEQIIFPEIDYDKVKKVRGMDITIVTTAKNKDDAFSLIQKLGMPFVK